MVIAEIIDGVLQKLYNEIKTVHGENADDVINERFTYLSKRYKNLVNGEESSITVDYSDWRQWALQNTPAVVSMKN